MRRDYFTCVFLACIAGALIFVCFEPLYFKYGVTVPREFGLFESIFSSIYAVFFLIAVPVYTGLRRKYWVAVGLACYGLLAYLPVIFHPAQELISGPRADIFHSIIAMILNGIYGMVNAPFASLSQLWGDSVASSMSLWIFPLAVLIPFIFKAYRFYRDAYVAEQLSPADVMSSPSISKFDRQKSGEEKEETKPEVLGTVISAPVRKEKPVAEQPTEPPKPVVERIEEPPQPALDSEDDGEVILLGPPKQVKEDNPQNKPSIRQPKINIATLGEEIMGREDDMPEDVE